MKNKIRKISALVVLVLLVLVIIAQAIPAPPGRDTSPPGISDQTGWSVDGNMVWKTDPEGNVGIGTVTPAYKLDVDGPIRTNDSLIVGSGTMYGSDFINLPPNAGLDIDLGTLYIGGPNDRVGIGTTKSELEPQILVRNYTL
jgi:hypothetical protein